MTRWKHAQSWLALTLILLVGAGLRLDALGHDLRLHPDEALFSTFAREAALNGAWLLPGDLDKPPLAIYAGALSMTLTAARLTPEDVLDFSIRQGEFAARLPNTFAGIILIAVVYALGRALYRERRIGLLAAGLIALSPLALAFSATAFTDGLMLTLMTLALLMIAGRSPRWSWAGLWLGLAFASKPQALFYLPLVIGLGLALHRTQRPIHALAHFVLPPLLVIAALLVWDAARGQSTSMWALAAANNNPARLIRADEWLPRLGAWLGYAQAFFSPRGLALLPLIPLITAVRIRRQPACRAALIDVALLTFVLAYGLLHWLVAFNLYDRYLLPLLPTMCLLGASALLGLWDGLPRLRALWLAAGLMVMGSMLLGAFEAGAGRGAVGADRGRHAGIDQLADYLNAQPLGAIIYDHWLNWELGFYMGQWSDKRRVYYPSTAALTADALAQPDPADRFFPFPRDQAAEPWLEALEAAGFAVERVYDQAGFVVYRLTPPMREIGG